MEQTFYDPTTVNPLPNPVSATTPTHEKPKWLITLLLVLFPPLAMYYMYKDPTYHHWIAKTTLSISLSMILFLLAQILFGEKQFSALYDSLHVTDPLPFLNRIGEITIFIYVLISLACFWFLRIKKEAPEYKVFLIVMLVLLGISFLLSAYISQVMLQTAIAPLLNSVGSTGNLGL